MFFQSKPKHKVFISYYHAEDQYYKNYIDTYLSNNIINKSVVVGEYNSDNSDEYIKRLIREEKISDSSVVVVLVGKNTKKRKHVDWEISAALRKSVNGCSALIGILLPSVTAYGGLSLKICHQGLMIMLVVDMPHYIHGIMLLRILTI